ncbi:MAG: hypothetical protein HY660_14915 [Armatimonadetes bacterium]|nr:hypothetical protein [Armatimonadota bacterium]
MIVEMSRVLIVGPKRLLGQVVDEVQRLGILHIDRIEAEEVPAVTQLSPGAEESQEQVALERLAARMDGLLSLLPSAGREAPPDTAALADVETSALTREIDETESRVREVTRQRLEAEEELELIDAYEDAVRVLSPLLGELEGSKHLESVGFILKARDATVLAALRVELERLTEGRVEILRRTIDDDRTGVVVAFHKRDAEAVRSFLARAGLTELRLPSRFAGVSMAEAVQVMTRRRQELPRAIEQATKEIRRLSEAHRARLRAIRTLVADRLTRLQVLPNFAQSRFTFLIHGWAPARSLSQVRGVLRRTHGEEVLVYDTPADPHEAEAVPVLLDNHPFIKPFQRLLALFMPPRYGFWDPSPVFAISFPIFVGLVIGDVGYGILIFLLGHWLAQRAKAGQPLEIKLLSLRFNPDVVGDLSFLVRICAGWMILFGAIYGEVFGNLPELLFHVKPIFHRTGEHERDLYFKLILLSGVVMVYTGLLIHLVLAFVHRHRTGIFESLTLIFGVSALLLGLGAMGNVLPQSFLKWGGIAALGALATAAASMKPGSLMWLLESFTGFGHVLSHARLLAFGLAAALLADTANTLGRMAGSMGIVIGIFVGIVVHTLFFALTIFGHVIQPARLHWVEFLTKFKYHEETGRPYRPFHKRGGD